MNLFLFQNKFPFYLSMFRVVHIDSHFVFPYRYIFKAADQSHSVGNTILFVQL